MTHHGRLMAHRVRPRQQFPQQFAVAHITDHELVLLRPGRGAGRAVCLRQQRVQQYELVALAG